MRSWLTARPGEHLSCVGCHEPPSVAPPMRMTEASRKRPAGITPWNGPARNYEFAREVQPVLDAYCTSCHASSKPEGNALTISYEGKTVPYLGGGLKIKGYQTGMKGNGGNSAGHFTISYFNLFRYTRHSGIESEMQLQMPMEFHADATELISMLEKGHPSTGHVQVKLSDEHMDRLVTWIDLNRPFFGRWSEIRGEPAVAAENQRAAMRERFGDVCENHEALSEAVVISAVEPVRAPTPGPPTPLAAPHAGPRPAQTNRVIELDDGVSLELVYVPSGSFAMGSRTGHRDETPVTMVDISRAFWMGKFEVSNRQFSRFDPHHDSRREDRHGYQFGARSYAVNAPEQPAVRLNWQQANQFCHWLSRKTGMTVRLPTESEWEWACRAGTTSTMNYGDVHADFAAYGNMADVTLHHFSTNPYMDDWRRHAVNNPGNIYDNWVPQIGSVNDGGLISTPVGHYRPNRWGLHDMHGNVAEWTASLYRPYPYRDHDGRNDPAADGKRVVRGGSWRDRPSLCTSSYRRAYRNYQPVFNVGFRVLVEQ